MKFCFVVVFGCEIIGLWVVVCFCCYVIMILIINQCDFFVIIVVFVEWDVVDVVDGDILKGVLLVEYFKILFFFDY